MLSFARRQELKPEPIDLAALVAGMTELLQSSLGPSVTLETRFPLGLRSVNADANQLELALLNLAVNARDAMPNGGNIVIAAREEIAPGGSGLKLEPHVCLSVTDFGVGMDEATLSKALDPFFTTKGVGKGTGLGLSMVHGMAEQSGGQLRLKSRKGQGTTAELWLPIAKSAGDPSRDNSLRGQGEARGLPLKVLAVDDDALVLMNTEAMLEDLGHTVFAAISGTEALDILRREEEINLVITDQAMPQMTGSQLAEVIKAGWPHLPIIMATGYAELPTDANENLPRLAKPFGQSEVAKAIALAMRTTARTPTI